MKTLSEYEKERTEKERLFREAIKKRDLVWLQEVEDKHIPLIDKESITHYAREDWKEKVRKSMVNRLGIACDHCGTELVDPSPGTVLMSYPPKIRVGCIGCGWSGFMRS